MAVGVNAALHHPDQNSPRVTRPDRSPPGEKEKEKRREISRSARATARSNKRDKRGVNPRFVRALTYVRSTCDCENRSGREEQSRHHPTTHPLSPLLSALLCLSQRRVGRGSGATAQQRVRGRDPMVARHAGFGSFSRLPMATYIGRR